ncbi:FAD-dependent monooxygenase [Streptomyces sp. NPDC058195]|uniref:FAD-dependent monooxygenase n=1 Tax=Streptomyces sp. NPDC058195 TaxID=3346375 RepID=UPI0036ECC4F5
MLVCGAVPALLLVIGPLYAARARGKPRGRQRVGVRLAPVLCLCLWWWVCGWFVGCIFWGGVVVEFWGVVVRGVGVVRGEVVVVGGGPVGLLLAGELAGLGVGVVVVESRGGVSVRPKATTLHARAVQVLARRGFLPGGGFPFTGGPGRSVFHFAGLGGLVVRAPAREPVPVVKCVQAELEGYFEARAVAAGVRVLRGCRVTGVSQDGGGVRVSAVGPDGGVVCTGLYAVGADGSRGMVREWAGIASDTFPASVSALMGTVTLARPGELGGGWHRTPRGWIVAKHGAGGCVHVRTLNCAGAHPGWRVAPSLEELRAEVSWIAGRDVAMGDARWLSRFSDFARVAGTFRAGRVFLAGDAAHVHFPIGGQGLSTGVLDALNLGWKLALAVRGRAAPGLLDTYDAERRPAAARVVEQTRAQLALMRPGGELDALRTVFTGVLSADRGYLGAMVSGQDTVLPGHGEGAGEFLGNMVLSTPDGETDVMALLREGRPLLLLFGEEGGVYEEEARRWRGTVRVVRAGPGREGEHCALLVRPDGYTAWVPGGRGLAEVLGAYFLEDRAVGGPAGEGGFPAGCP